MGTKFNYLGSLDEDAKPSLNQLKSVYSFFWEMDQLGKVIIK
jgi:hypothetical protein